MGFGRVGVGTSSGVAASEAAEFSTDADEGVGAVVVRIVGTGTREAPSDLPAGEVESVSGGRVVFDGRSELPKSIGGILCSRSAESAETASPQIRPAARRSADKAIAALPVEVIAPMLPG